MSQQEPLRSRMGAGAPTSGALPLLVGALFFFSGSAGLVYQVLWMRSLGLLFGSDMYGVSIILSTFMGGLALGSLLGGHWAERSARPLLWYGVAELGIGVAALLFASFLDLLQPLLSSVYAEFGATSLRYQGLRVILSSGALLVPTTLMGATLPLILRHFARSRSTLGSYGGAFYAINTLGALAGTLAAGFLLLPYLGMVKATLCAAIVNLVIGFICSVIGWRTRVPSEPIDPASQGERRLDPLPDVEAHIRRRIANAALLAFGLSGVASFALEVVWTRILLVSFSATVYSFASMLSCFLFGIFLGSLLISRRVDQHSDPARLFGVLELGVGASVAALCLLINVVPGFFGGLLGAWGQILGASRGGALVAATLSASFVLLVVPTTLLGATFAVALRTYTTSVERVGTRTGNLYFANTLGAITGALGATFFLIPTFGRTASMGIIAALFTLNGLYLLAARGRGLRELISPGLGSLVTLAVVGIVAGLSIPYRVTLNFNQRAGVETQLVYHDEGIQNTIDVVRSRSGVTSLIIGGNVEADDGVTQKRHFILKGHLPLLFLEQPKRVLVIGLGMGITLRASARHPGVEHIDVVELSPQIVAAQSVLVDINDDVLANPLIQVRIDDGRNFVKMSEMRYDMITADPIHPKVSRVGYLYTREYYQDVRERLAEDGVICQWMPLYQIAPERLRSAMRSFAEVFPNGTLWYVKNHALFVAKRDGTHLDYALLERRLQDPAVSSDLASIGVQSIADLLELMIMGPDEVAAFIADGDSPLNTDDYPYLEYFVPSDLFVSPMANVSELLRFQTDPTHFVVGLPEGVAGRIRQRLPDRGTRLLQELGGPPEPDDG